MLGIYVRAHQPEVGTMRLTTLVTMGTLALLLPGRADAQSGNTFGAELLEDLAGIEEKYVSLAEALPANAYTWRPAEGVRSVSEVFMHVAGANYLFPQFFGTPAPSTAPPRDAEKSWTDKQQVVSALKESFAHLRGAIERLQDESLRQTVKMFGQDVTTRKALLVTFTHLHEHLGQSIAYARTNKVTPPWSGGGE
jgi:uncharacterized damage-inducible protein DinB